MKTKEFVNKVEALGYEVSYDWGTLYIKRNRFTILDLGNAENWDIDTDYPEFERMGWNDKKELMTIVSEYMLTDPIDRKEEKRYYLRFIHPNILGAREPFYLHLHHSESAKDYYDIGTVKAPFGNKLQTIFTESEIAQMDITGFEKVEVSE